MIKSFVWPFVNRFSHILLILCFGLSYILSDFEKLLPYHVAFGLGVGVLLLFRALWGFVGPKYSQFKDFNFNLQDLKEYLLSPFSKKKEHVGHNPASSFAIVAMIIMSILTVLSGLLAYGIGENHGILSFLHTEYFSDMKIFKEIHAVFANVFVGIVVVHICGALIDKFIKKGDAIDSMIHGYKQTQEEAGIRLNFMQYLFGFIWIVGSLYALYYFIFVKDNIFVANANVPQNYAALNQDFAKECGSCHLAFPPFLLPQASWKMMMQDLEHHFGDDASLDATTNKSITTFLTENSAEHSTHQAALGILHSLEHKSGVIAITKTPFWERKHRHIKEGVFASNEVKSKANCQACHANIEKGLIENDMISIPKIREG